MYKNVFYSLCCKTFGFFSRICSKITTWTARYDGSTTVIECWCFIQFNSIKTNVESLKYVKKKLQTVKKNKNTDKNIGKRDTKN